MKNFSKNKMATTLVIVATVILAGVAIFSAVRLYNLRTESVTPSSPESEPSADCGEESCWEECNGWQNAGYNASECRKRALRRALNGSGKTGGQPYYNFGLPDPPSGIKDPNAPGATNGPDQAWYGWGMSPTSEHFLSHGTSCGLGPAACSQPTNTPTPTNTVTPTPTGTPGSCTPLEFTISSSELACLGDRVVYDDDHDGIQDAGEDGVSEIDVELFDDQNDVIDDTTTDEDGYYEFCSLEPGEYYVGFDIDERYTISTQGAGNDACVDSDADSSGFTDSVSLDAGDNYRCLDALIYEEGDEPTNTPTPTNRLTPTPTNKLTPTPTSKLTPTPTDDPDVGGSVSTPTPTSAPSADLPQAGFGAPTIMIAAFGIVLAILAVAIAL